MTVVCMRGELARAYDSPKWQWRVSRMKDEHIIAIYNIVYKNKNRLPATTRTDGKVIRYYHINGMANNHHISHQ